MKNPEKYAQCISLNLNAMHFYGVKLQNGCMKCIQHVSCIMIVYFIRFYVDCVFVDSIVVGMGLIIQNLSGLSNGAYQILKCFKMVWINVDSF